MKNLFLLLAFCCVSAAVFAQALPKKYVFLEHFTNTKCPICASKNPAFYDLIQNYPDDVRHLAVHPPVPYNSCKVYLANPSENVARSAVYGIDGTPRVALNGTLQAVSTPLLQATALQAALGQTSPIAITVAESGIFPTKTATITIHTYGAVPAGNYKLFAAVADRTVDYASPNGEKVHHDVFRAMLPNINGEAISLPAVGGSASYTYSYTFTAPGGWTSNYDSLYVLAFVQDATTKEVLNTGTRFDPVFTGTDEAAAPQAVRIAPNPATSEAWADLPGASVDRVEVYSIGGRLLRRLDERQDERARVPVDGLSAGMYVLRLVGAEGIFVGKVVKE